MRDGAMEIFEAKAWLKNRFGQGVLFNEPMSRHTSLGVGGPADCLVTAESIADIEDLLAHAQKWNQPVFVLGKGTNLLVSQNGIRGIVIRLGKGFSHLEVLESDGRRALVQAGAGASLGALCRFAARHGLGGMNFAAGIPGAMGGAVMMNAGTKTGCMADRIKRLTVVTRESKTLVLDHTDVDWSYRKADFSRSLHAAQAHGFIVTHVVVELFLQDPAMLEQELDSLLLQRKKSQPVMERSAGCFFKNPPQGQPAGMLIERAGLKGTRLGGAEVSCIHANFLINAGGATADDMLNLMNLVRERVAAATGVDLEPEVRIIGA